jgi:hypothetical protein
MNINQPTINKVNLESAMTASFKADVRSYLIWAFGGDTM